MIKPSPIVAKPSPQKTEMAEALMAAGPSGAVAALAEASRTRLLEMGAPIRRDEYWRYTDPSRLTRPEPTAEPAVSAARAQDPFDAADRSVDAHTLVFANGRFRPDLSDAGAPEGVEIAPLTEAGWAAERIGVLEAAGQSPAPRPLAALNGAMLTDGLAIRATGRAARPLRIQHVGEGDGARYERIVIAVDAGAEATLLEAGVGPGRLNTVLEADIAEGGALHHARLQSRPDAAPALQAATHLFARLGADSRLKSFTLSAGAGADLVRNEYVVWLEGAEGSAHIAGGVLLSGDATIDNTLFLTHDAERCESRQVFKNVVGGAARAVFQGKILVQEPAQKTDGYQISQSVLLDDRSAFHAKPELEIYADDVICSHGSTTGALDADHLFYLRARGVPEAVAQSLLVQAFVEDAILEIEDAALQDVVRAEAARLVADLSAARPAAA